MTRIDALYNKFEETQIRVVAYADPPGGSVGAQEHLISTCPGGWASSAVDKLRKGVRFRYYPSVRTLDATFCPLGGPVVLFELPCSAVLKKVTFVHHSGHRFNFQLTALCAYVEYNTSGIAAMLHGIPVELVKDTVVREFLFQNGGGGCNAASECFFPNAGHFVRKLREYRKREIAYGDLEIKVHAGRLQLSDQKVKELFPNWDFKANRILEQFAAYTRGY